MDKNATSVASGGTKARSFSHLWSWRFLLLYVGIVALGYALFKVWFDDCCSWSDMWIHFTISFLILVVAMIWIARVWLRNRDARLIEKALEGKKKPHMSAEDLDVAIREQRKELETMYMKRKQAELLLQAEKLNNRIRQRNFV